jgi:hypothetical protein
MKNEELFRTVYKTAMLLGREAAEQCTPTPMVVCQRNNPLNDQSEIVKQYHVPQGVCGFAWAIIRPGNSPFANWLKKYKLGGKAYEGGVCIWMSDYEQCYEKKVAHCSAMVRYLKRVGIKAYLESRLD